MKLFCQQCFAKIEYKFSKPKFCPECGKQIGLVLGKTQTVDSVKNNDADRIKELELQLEEFKNGKDKLNKNKFSSKNIKNYENNEDEEEQYDDEDYDDTQRHIDNFKRKKIKNGVSIEKDLRNKGVSFGQLMEGASSGSAFAGDEFKMNDNSPRKTDQQILEELRIEASSKSRTIEID